MEEQCPSQSQKITAYFHRGFTKLPRKAENVISIINAILLIKNDKTHEAFSLNIARCGVISLVLWLIAASLVCK